MRLETRRAVANRRRQQLCLDRRETLRGVGARARRILESRARLTHTRHRAVRVAHEITHAHVVLELVAKIGERHPVLRNTRVLANEQRLRQRLTGDVETQ